MSHLSKRKPIIVVYAWCRNGVDMGDHVVVIASTWGVILFPSTWDNHVIVVTAHGHAMASHVLVMAIPDLSTTGHEP